ncbi:MAG: hypothetical protein Q7K40_02955 [bacterium]|nr:hypothetical protein [bacterium]
MIRSIASLLGLVVAGFVFFQYTQPTYGKVRAIQADIEQYNQALDKADELQQLKDSLISRYNAFDPSAIQRLHKMLPDHVDNIRLILDLDGVASRFGMALQNVVISNPASEAVGQTAIGAISAGKQKYDSLTLKFTTRGTYENFVRFLEELESSLRIVDMVSLTVTPESSISAPIGVAGGPRPGPASTYRYDITIRTYWLR